MPRPFLLFLLCVPTFLHAQTLFDPFEDGNFQNPDWSGDTTQFVHDPQQFLQSNGPAATDTLSIATSFNAGAEIEWRFDAGYPFAPSTSNYLRVYLSADTSNLAGELNGYFVQAGESGSNDSYDLYRQDGNSREKIIDGIEGQAGNQIGATIRVRRSASGMWTLETGNSFGGWILQGDTTDQTYPINQHAGLFVRHSSTRNQSFSFDNFYIGPWEVDVTAPEIVEITDVGEFELKVVYNEAIDSAALVDLSNYVVDMGIGAPFFAQQIAPNEVELEFSTPFASGISHTLTVTNISDISGNVAGSLTAKFTYNAPISYFEGMVRFNEIHFDPTPSAGLPEVEYLELENRSDDFLDMSGWTIGTAPTGGSTIDSASLNPGSLLLLTDDDDLGLFPNTNITSLSPWVALVNSGRTLYLSAPDGTMVDSITYKPSFYSISSKANGGYSLEKINPNSSNCPPFLNWDGSSDPSGGTPGRENALYDPLFDQEPAMPVSSIVIADSIVEVCFSHPMSRTNLDDEDKFILEGIGQPQEVIIQDPFAQCVTLIFDQEILLGDVYTLRILLQGSCFGSGLPETTIEVVKGLPPFPGDIYVNEIMADESPSAGLPEREYLELYCNSNVYIDISGGGVSDGGPIANWGNLQIGPGEYVIVVDREDSLEFSSIGRVIAVDDLPSLNNAGDNIELYDRNGNLLDELRYSNTWYRDATKSEGGFSLEKIDPTVGGCSLAGNWQASNAAEGGTPGAENTVKGTFVDDVPPSLLNVRMADEQTIVLTFDEPLALSSENEIAYSVSAGFGFPLLTTLSEDRTEIFLTYGVSFPENQVYEVNYSVIDCTGNLEFGAAEFGRPTPIVPGDLLINEVLFNPFPGGSDFVEIINASEKILDLSELVIGEGVEGTDSVTNTDRVAPEGHLMLPGDIRCLTRDVAFQIDTYFPLSNAEFLEMSGFPTYADDEGEVVLLLESGEELDRFRYLDDYHYADLRDENGISLERISLRIPTNQPDNWHSAASTVRFATPGYRNSQRESERLEQDDPVYAFPETITPDGDGVDDVLGINYAFATPGINARVTILDRGGRLIKTVRQQELLGSRFGTFFWDGRQESGNKAPVGAYLVIFEATNQTTGIREVFRVPVVVGN